MDKSFIAHNQSRMLGELSEFLSIPSISALPAHAADCRRAAEWLKRHLTQLGCPVVNIIEGPGHPVVWAEGPRVAGAPTLLIYGHYDVQPPDPLDEWMTAPFTPTVRDGKLFARGSSDDKGQVYCLLKAYESVLDADRRRRSTSTSSSKGRRSAAATSSSTCSTPSLSVLRPTRCWSVTCRTTHRAGQQCTPLSVDSVMPRSTSARCSGISIPAPTGASPPTPSRPWSAYWRG